MNAIPFLLAIPLLAPAGAPSPRALPPAPQLRAEKYGSGVGMTCPVEIHPGQSLGPIRLGQTRAEVAAIGLPRRAVTAFPAGEIHGRYEVLFRDDRVIGIDLPLAAAPDCLRYRGKGVSRKSTLAEWRAVLPRCLPEESRLGGNLTVCAGVELARGGWGGESGLTLRLRGAENLSEATASRIPDSLKEALRSFAPKNP